MSTLLWIGAGVVIAGGMAAAAASATLKRLSQSDTAARLGLDNVPSGRDRDRLLHSATYEPLILRLLSESNASVRTTSGYRSWALNAAVGGAPTSRHRYGLALDFGGFSDFGAIVAGATHLRANAARLPITLRTVIAEDDHLHVDLFDPFGELDAAPTATTWLQEDIAGITGRRFTALA